MPFRLHAQGLFIALGLGLLAGLIGATSGNARRALYRVEIPLAPDRAAQMQVFWDQGQGYREDQSGRITVPAGAQPTTFTFPLAPGPVHGIRLDPFTTTGQVVVGPAVIRDSTGAEWERLDVTQLSPLNQIETLQIAEGQATLVTTDAANDPSVEWRLATPIQLPFGPKAWWQLGGGPALIVALITAALIGFAFPLRKGETPQTPGARVAALGRRWPWLGLGAATLVIWAGTLVSLPLPPTTYLDPSWQQAMVWARLHDLQFGRDVIFTAGPWSWLFSNFYIDGLLGAKLLWEALGKLALAAALVASTRDVPGVRRAVLLATFALLGGLVLDVWIILLITFLGLSAVLPARAGWRAIVPTLLVFTFFAQVKFTLAVLTLAIVGLGSLASLWRRDWRRALLMPGIYVAAFLGWWLLAGQNPIRILRWASMSLEISGGYASAMGVDPSPSVLAAGVATLAGFGWYLWRQLVTTPAAERPDRWPVIALTAGVTFIAWKHGFTRADGHVMIFFFTVTLLIVMLPAYLPTRSRIWRVELIPLIALSGVWLADDTLLANATSILRGRLHATSQGLGRPQQFLAWWRSAAESEKERVALPAIREAVGSDTIDFINAEQGWLMLNDLAYHPRPVPQSYSVYTPELMSRNLGWLQRDDRAAEYLLFNYATIDGRYAAQDDALLIADLPRRYEPVARERNLLLARRRDEQPPADGLRRELLTRANVAFGAPITLPTDRLEAMWLKLFPVPSGLGRLRAAAYKPPELYLIVREINGHETRHRLVPAAAAEGFVVQPYLPDLDSLEAFLRQEAPRQVESVRVEHPAGEGEYWSDLVYELATVPAVRLNELKPTDLVRRGIANVPALELNLPVPAEFFSVDGAPALLAHSPGRVRFAASEKARSLTGRFGLREGSYTQGARTDGVTFAVRSADGEQLWSRRLEPVASAGDRGPQTFTVTIPAGTAVELTTEPGSNADWDWSYWSRLEFTP